jgi:hypothetical protein
MKRLAVAAFSVVALASSPSSAQTKSTAVEALSQCLVGETKGRDRILIARWIGSALASAPQLEGLVTIEPAEREGVNREMAGLFTRLLTQDCPDEARPLFATGNTEAFGLAFQTLGEVAMQELMADPVASAAIGSFTTYLKQEEFEDLFK